MMRLAAAILFLALAVQARALPRQYFELLAPSDPRQSAEIWFDASDAASWTGATTTLVSRGLVSLSATPVETSVVSRVDFAQNDLSGIAIAAGCSELRFTKTSVPAICTMLAIFTRPVAAQHSHPIAAGYGGGYASPLAWSTDNKHWVQWNNGYRASTADARTGTFLKCVTMPTTNVADAVLCINGTNTALGAATAFNAWTQLSSLGAYAIQQFSASGFNLYEIIVWYRALSEDDLLWVQYVLNDKWRIW